MDKSINLSNKFKAYFVPIILFILSFALIYFAIIPQIFSIPDKKQQMLDQESQLASLTNSLNVLRSISSQNLDRKVQLANTALPNNKDIELIYQSVAVAALKSNVEIAAFGTRPGKIYSKDGNIKEGEFETDEMVLKIQAISGEARNLTRFSNEIQKILPLHDVKILKLKEDKSTYEVTSFYKPSDIKSLVERQVVNPLSREQEELLKVLESQWNAQSSVQASLSAF
ncbi:MAG: hypothetical protein A2857_06440 [Candidatus Levybacteria bacterium RIFCSPHIGHO2_01_FULL_36_15]|nr:MAG: hypothetical protein A2857_06440 [Candidatus Levybacteria bacterium RIFCSPHIGHO2_01_FULL_36_15]OGH39004.1 MAG: hypothetical protein A2905_06655 [Candidatus Levybacteria bacterium RIFCSPLOWO2_01_FULL_36_10]